MTCMDRSLWCSIQLDGLGLSSRSITCDLNNFPKSNRHHRRIPDWVINLPASFRKPRTNVSLPLIMQRKVNDGISRQSAYVDGPFIATFVRNLRPSRTKQEKNHIILPRYSQCRGQRYLQRYSFAQAYQEKVFNAHWG